MESPPPPPESPPKPKRRPGRPRRGDETNLPWPTIDRLLVFGETSTDPKTGEERVRFPSLRDLAERYGVSPHLIWSFSNKQRCLKRRNEAHLKTQARVEEKLVEKLSSARALAAGDLVRVTDRFISLFERELSEGRVRADSPADFDRFARLRELLIGNVDSRQELQGGITLEAIQQRHRQVRAQVDGLTPELAGTASTRDDAGTAAAPVAHRNRGDHGGEERGDGADD